MEKLFFGSDQGFQDVTLHKGAREQNRTKTFFKTTKKHMLALVLRPSLSLEQTWALKSVCCSRLREYCHRVITHMRTDTLHHSGMSGSCFSSTQTCIPMSNCCKFLARMGYHPRHDMRAVFGLADTFLRDKVTWKRTQVQTRTEKLARQQSDRTNSGFLPECGDSVWGMRGTEYNGSLSYVVHSKAFLVVRERCANCCRTGL